MPDVSEGLTIEGESVPSGDLSDAAFEQAVAAQVGKTPQAPTPTGEDAPGSTYAQARAEVNASPAEIQKALLGEESTTVADGFTVEGGVDRHGHTAADRRQIHEEYVRSTEEYEQRPETKAWRERSQQQSGRIAEGEAAIEQLAAGQFFAAWNDPNATDEARAQAAFELRSKAPATYAKALEVLDDAELEWAGDAWDDEEDELPSVALDADVRQLEARRQLEGAIRKQEKLSQHIIREKVQAVKEVYAGQGITSDDLETAYLRDRDALAQMGVDLESLDADGTRAALEVLQAAGQEYAIADRHDAIRRQVAGAETTDVSSGFEVQTAFGWQKEQPQGSPIANLSQEELTARIEARVRANKPKPATRRVEFYDAVLGADPTDWRSGLTAGGLKGQRALELADGSRERHEREQREAREEALRSAGGW